MREMRNAYKVSVANSEGRYNLEDPGTDGRIILICILNKQYLNVWTGLNQLKKNDSSLFSRRNYYVMLLLTRPTGIRDEQISL
jgi:hypothetical protein